MYQHCIVCSASLGENAEVEHFAHAERIAFDPDKGRLWAICRRCDRWNLAPMDSRWEALEELEKLWEKVPVRVSGERMALARTLGGAWILRVGEDPHPTEFAFWRWGKEGKRPRKRRGFKIRWPELSGVQKLGLAMGGGAVAAGVAMAPVVGLPVLGYVAGMVGVSLLPDQAFPNATLVVDRDGRPIMLGRGHLRNAGMTERDDDLGWSIQIQQLTDPSGRPVHYTAGHPTTGLAQRFVEYTGDEAIAIARRAFPLLNRRRNRNQTVADALGLIGDAPEPGRYLAHAAAEKPRWVAFKHYPEPMRLAIEMALFQERERAAMEGKLAELEAAWEEAEALAAISDDLLPPKGWDGFRRKALGS